ncbi:TetR/AcrR family transcriptional regulator [Nocardioides sp. CFH 31398]|uniref:TetR/AcrR family transcriptional regulator n=1 Tax=Nocardioides sp. CFH 31398 TaxID=2919579 RepID=UPI001F06F40D|nr:TetR/AcrR family transcriptional regulator C-terminal domain-containing protein [Nocardioides sp. CFH 31398]MCH1865461.1 TetR/AcrR family transcriptional regulator C-terminal domain-containing protein [Nocardioides sp. CFH 31398]
MGSDSPPGAGGTHDPDAALIAGDDLPSARVPLDKDRIVAAAVTFIEENGLPGLSMRRLGRELGVEAMSLYRYVPGKEEVLDSVVERIMGTMADDPEVRFGPEDGWQDFLQRLAHGVRRVALQHPKCFPLVASRPPEAPWLRPPLRDLRWVEIFLASLIAEGFTRSAAVQAYRAFTGFLLGTLLLEVAGRGADLGPIDTIDDGSVIPGDLGDFPTVAALAEPLSEDHMATEFEETLETLIDRLALVRAEG